MEIIWRNAEGTVIPFPSEGKGTLLMMNDGNGALSATIPGPYYSLPDRVMPGANPVPVPEQEKNATPSIDPYITERDRWTVASLPPEGRKQFGDNVHRYIRQLGKDYLDEADDAAS